MSGGGYGSDDTSAWQDMRDGGGKGRSGPTFEGGGIISTIGNAMGGPGNAPFTIGGDDGGNNRIRNQPGTNLFQDAINGGGLGYQGDNFQGLSLVSDLANVFTYPFRDSTSIGLAMQSLDENEEFLKQTVPGSKYTFGDVKAAMPGDYNRLKQQFIMNSQGATMGFSPKNY